MQSSSTPDRLQNPYHPDVEFYLLEHRRAGAISPITWERDRPGTSFSTGDLDEAMNRTVNEYAMKTEYRGSARSQQVDFHSITLSAPESKTFTIEVAFDGSPNEFWEDDRYTAGIRPRTQNE